MNSSTAASMYSVFESERYLNVTPLNALSRNKRRKNCEESRWRSQSAPVCPLAMSCLDTQISLVPISINSWYLQPYWTLQYTSEQTKPQRYIRSVHRHMSCCLYNRGVCNSTIRNEKVDCNKYGKMKL